MLMSALGKMAALLQAGDYHEPSSFALNVTNRECKLTDQSCSRMSLGIAASRAAPLWVYEVYVEALLTHCVNADNNMPNQTQSQSSARCKLQSDVLGGPGR